MRCHYANAKRWNALTRRLGLLRLHALHELARVRGREPDRVRAPRLSAARLALLRLWSRKIERIGLIADVAVIAASVVPSLRVPSEEARECTGRVGVVVFAFALHADIYRHESRPSSLHLDLSVPATEDHARAVIDALVRRVAPNAVFDVGRRGVSRGRGHRGGRRAMRFNATNYPVRHGSGLSPVVPFFSRKFVASETKHPFVDFYTIVRLSVRMAIRNFRTSLLACISNRISTLVEKRVVGGRHAAAPAQSDAPGVAARGRVRDGDSRVCATRGRPLLSPAAGSEPASDTRVPGLDAAGCRARFERPRPRTYRDAPRVPRWTSRTVGRDAASVTRRAAARPRSADRAPRWARLGRDGSRW